MEYELKRGQALVITGPQGCGKSTLARKIADEHGAPFIEADASQLETYQGLNDLMASEPETLIVDGFPHDNDMQDWLKAVISSDAVEVDRIYSAPKMVRAPNFIFCTSDAAPFQLAADDRRFRVVQLGTNSATTPNVADKRPVLGSA